MTILWSVPKRFLSGTGAFLSFRQKHRRRTETKKEFEEVTEMTKNLELKENRLSEITGDYKAAEFCEYYNITAQREMRADICSKKEGFLHVTLLERNTEEFEEVRVLLAGVKNEEVYLPEMKIDEDHRGFEVDIRFLMDALENSRNKSTRILLETMENGDYRRYNLMNDKTVSQNKEISKGLISWIEMQRCTEIVHFMNEDGEEVPYMIAIYMDQKGRWFLSLGTEARAEAMSRVCDLQSYSIKKEKITLNLKMETDGNGYEMDSVLLIFRSKLKEEREEHRFEILKNRQKGKYSYIKASIDLAGINLKSLYWDACVRYVKKSTGDSFNCFISMSKPLRYFTAFMYVGKHRAKEGFFLYPYNTSSKKLAFQYREEGEFDRAAFRIKEIVAMSLYYLFLPYWKSKRIQLVYEKFCMMAQDNGYYFFKHCMENDEEERLKSHIYYVITKDSADRSKLEPYMDHVIDFMSLRHMIYMQAANLLVSTDTRSQLYAMRQRGSILKRALRKKPLVFLQHGVTALKRVDFFYGKGKAGSCDLFVVTSDFEKQIVKENFGYEEDEIVNSGFARWDVLEDKSQGLREILIMPTWRSWLENATPEEFKESDYFRNYMELLNSSRFHNFLKNNDLKANFYLHSKFREFMQDFSVESERIRLIAFGEEPANELMMHCKMLVTDYSSVCWDVFYLDKPVVFFQFDRDKYEEAHGSYLDMSKDLFGDCAQDVDGLLGYMEKCVEDDFRIQPKYEKMRNNFYKYFDNQNSRRICDAIVKKWPGK